MSRENVENVRRLYLSLEYDPIPVDDPLAISDPPASARQVERRAGRIVAYVHTIKNGKGVRWRGPRSRGGCGR